MLRNSRFRPPPSESDIWNTPRARDTLLLFNTARLLPANWMHALIPEAGAYHGAYTKLLTRMVRAGLLSRRTINGNNNLYETMSYSRTELGVRWLDHYNQFTFTGHNRSPDTEQVLVDIADAQIILGAKKYGYEFHPWHDIEDHPLTPNLPEHPFRFDIEKHRLTPDGHPFYLKRGNKSILFLKEFIRTNNKRKALVPKVHHYRLLEAEIKKRYGFTAMMVLWITINERDRLNLEKHIKAEFTRCAWMLTNLYDISGYQSTIPVSTHLVDTPWRRVGHPPFSIATFEEV